MKKILLSLSVACFGLLANTSSYGQAFTQTFETVTPPALPTLPMPWTNVTTGGGGGWVTHRNSFAWPSRGFYRWPLYQIPDHTTYCFVDDDGTYYNNPSKLTTPTFSLVGITNPVLNFDKFYIKAHLNSGVAEQAWVEISTDGGSTWALLDSIGVSTVWATQSKSLSAYTTAATCALRFVYTDNGGATGTNPSGIIGVAIDNVSVVSAVANDIAIIDYIPKATAIYNFNLPSTTSTFEALIRNNGTTPVSSFTYSYQAGTSTPVTTTITPSTPVAAYGTYSFVATTPYTVPAGHTPVKMWVSLPGDANHANDSATTEVVGVAAFPQKTELYEEATGTWCGYCVRGIVYMDSLYKLHPHSVSIASVHNSDPMQSANASTIAEDQLMGTYIGGYPSMVIDRRDVEDPQDCLDIFTNDSGNIFGYATIAMTPSITSTTIGATVTVTPFTNMSGDYRLELIATEDKVHGTGTTWNQHNYYSNAQSGGSAGVLFGSGYNFQDSAAIIPGSSMYYPFVSRITIPSSVVATNGVASSLPATMTAGTPYTYTFTAATIPTTFNKDNMRVIVALVDNNQNNLTYGYVLNSVTSGRTNNEAAGVQGVTVGNVENMTVYPNPATDMAHIAFTLKEATNVQFSVYDMAGRVVYTHESEKMIAGGNQINITTSAYASGVYNVVITTDNGTVTQRFSVAK